MVRTKSHREEVYDFLHANGSNEQHDKQALNSSSGGISREILHFGIRSRAC